MNILLIAPTNPDLPSIDSEIAAINSYHEVISVVGTVRETDIAEAIGQHPEGFDIIWFVTHGGDIGVKLTDEILTADGVGQYLTASRARLCVLNTCASEALARQIIVGTDCDLIYTIADLADTDALRFGSLLAAELAKTDNFKVAFDLASPKRGKYKYLAAKAAIRSLDMTVSGELQKLGERVDSSNKRIEVATQDLYQMKVDAKAAAVVWAEIKIQLTGMQQEFSILRQQSQTRDMKEDLAKEGRNMAMAAMDRKIDNQVIPLPAHAAVPVREQAGTPLTTWGIIILLSILALASIFLVGRMF